MSDLGNEPTASQSLIEVRVQGLPVPIWAEAREHIDGLLREFTLLAAVAGPDRHAHVPDRLLSLLDELTARYDAMGAEQSAMLTTAAAAGTPEIDLTYLMPASAGEACTQLAEMLDAADRYCQAGELLLTLATPADALAFRQWYFSQFVDQIAGRPPTSWAQWRDRVRPAADDRPDGGSLPPGPA